MKSSLLFGAMFLAAFATAQTNVQTVPSRGERAIVPSAPIDTRSFVKPIDVPVKPLWKRPSENEPVRPWESGFTPNDLRPGRMDPSLLRVGRPRLTFPGPSFTQYFPPDPDLAVGPTNIVGVVNTSFAFFDKATGRRTFQQDAGTFFAGVGIQGEILSDPKVIYDPVSQRWFMTIIEVGLGTTKLSKMLVAVSDDADPNGTWYRYRIEARLVDPASSSNSWWLDYPGFGVNRETLVITGNMFPLEGTPGYGGNQFIVIPKAGLLTGSATVARTFQDLQAGTVKIPYSADSNVAYGVGWFDRTSLKVYGITGGAASPAIQSSIVPIPAVDYPGPISGPGGQIDSFDCRLFNAAWVNGSLVTAHGTAVSSSDRRQAVRWYEVRTGSWPNSPVAPTLTQSGQIQGSGSEQLHMPAITRNRRGDISLIYSRSTPSNTAELLIAARKVTDPRGSVGRPTVVASSTGAYSAYRWGDYFGVVVDPNDERTFWGIGMVGNGSFSWSTQVQSWRVNSFGDAAVPATLATAAPISGQGRVSGGAVSNLAVVDGRYLDVASQLVSGLGGVASVEANFTAPALVGRPAQYVQATVNAVVPAGSTAFLYLFNQSTRRYDLISTTTASTTGIAQFQSERFDTGASVYADANGRSRAAIRVVAPYRAGSSTNFTLRVDRFQVRVEPLSTE